MNYEAFDEAVYERAGLVVVTIALLEWIAEIDNIALLRGSPDTRCHNPVAD